MTRKGVIQKKILLLLLTCQALSFNYSRSKQWKALKEIHKEFEEDREDSIERASQSLFKSKLVEERTNKDGTKAIILTNRGRGLAISFDMESMKLPREEKWDGKWRVCMYDIPVRLNKVRESLRYQLKRIGMKEIQQSVFVYPYQCHKEIKYIIEFYNAWKYINFLEASFVSGEENLKKHFRI